jgi:hypothetical protein
MLVGRVQGNLESSSLMSLERRNPMAKEGVDNDEQGI